jgi:hypothetical protein
MAQTRLLKQALGIAASIRPAQPADIGPARPTCPEHILSHIAAVLTQQLEHDQDKPRPATSHTCPGELEDVACPAARHTQQGRAAIEEILATIRDALQYRQAALLAASPPNVASKLPAASHPDTLQEVEATITAQLQTLTDERRLLKRKKTLREVRCRVSNFRKTLHQKPKKAHAQIFGKACGCPSDPLHAARQEDGTVSTDEEGNQKHNPQVPAAAGYAHPRQNRRVPARKNEPLRPPTP